MCVGKTLNMGSCSKCWGNLKGIWGNPGEIPHIGWKIPGVYRVKFRPFTRVCKVPRKMPNVCIELLLTDIHKGRATSSLMF